MDLSPSGRRPAGLADALVGSRPPQPNEPLSLERPDQSADVAGIETQALPQVAQIGTPRPYLVEQTRLAQGAVPPEEVVIQRAGALGDEPVESADNGDLVDSHCLTLVRDYRAVQGAPLRLPYCPIVVEPRSFGEGRIMAPGAGTYGLRVEYQRAGPSGPMEIQLSAPIPVPQP